MPRQKIVGKKTTLSIREGLVGWVTFSGTQYPGGASEYLNMAAEADRDRAISEGGELLQRYRAYLVAMGYTSELDALDAVIVKTEA